MGLSSVRQVRGKGRGKGKKDGDVRSLLHNSLAIITRPHSVEIPASNSYPIIHVTLHWNIQKVFLTQPESILTIVLTELEVYVPNSMSNVIIAIARPHPWAPVPTVVWEAMPILEWPTSNSSLWYSYPEDKLLCCDVKGEGKVSSSDSICATPDEERNLSPQDTLQARKQAHH